MKFVGLGAALKALREEVERATRWTQKDFCDWVGVPKQTWNRFERNVSPIKEATLFAVLDRLSELFADPQQARMVTARVASIAELLREQFATRSMVSNQNSTQLITAHLERLDDLSAKWALPKPRDFVADILSSCLAWTAHASAQFDFEKALFAISLGRQLKPDDFFLKLRTAQMLLLRRDGDAFENWLKAFELLSEDIPSDLDVYPQYLAWRGVAWFRHPAQDIDRNLQMAEGCFRGALAGLRNNEEFTSDTLDANQWEGNLAIVLFQIGKRRFEVFGDRVMALRSWREALRLLNRSLKMWKSLNREYEANVTRKRLANFWQLSALLRAPEAAERGLRKGLKLYSEAAHGFALLDLPYERALAEYSWSDAELTLANCTTGSTRFQHIKNAIRLCDVALQVITPENGEDYGNAHWNRAEALRAKKNASLTDIESAITSYRETLRIFYRDYRETEWSDTHFPLSIAYFEHWKLSGNCESLRRAVASGKAAASISDADISKKRGYTDWLRKLEEAYVNSNCTGSYSYESVQASDLGTELPSPHVLRQQLLVALRKTLTGIVSLWDRSDQLPAVLEDLSLLALQSNSNVPNRRWFLTAANGILEVTKNNASASLEARKYINSLGILIWPDFTLEH